MFEECGKLITLQMKICEWAITSGGKCPERFTLPMVTNHSPKLFSLGSNVVQHFSLV